MVNGFFSAIFAIATMVISSTATGKPSDEITKSVSQVLDGFHKAASAANADKYFGSFAPEGIFIGTDATERWSVDLFREYARPFFSKGKGWTYTMVSRNIEAAPSGDVVWFDEILDNKSYGTCRGTGVLRKIGAEWKVAQYHLTIPVPNELADNLVKMIRENSAKSKSRK